MGLKILQWNASHLNAHLAELQQHLSSLPEEELPDLLCIQEAWLTANTIPSIPGYTAEHRMRKTQGGGGGVSTFIREGLAYTAVKPVGDLECLTIQLRNNYNKLFTVYNVYHPPANCCRSAMFEQDYRRLFATPNCFVVGDLNARSQLFGSLTTDTRGRRLEDLACEFHMTCLNNGQGSHISQVNGELSPLNVAFVSYNLATLCDWSVGEDPLGSDHHPCTTTFQTPFIIDDSLQAERWSYKRANWDRFEQDCLSEINERTVSGPPIKAYSRLTDTIINICNRNIPKITNKLHVNPVKRVRWWNEECDRSIRARNKMRSKARATRNIDDHIEYRRLKGVAQNIIKRAKEQSWHTYCTSLNEHSNVGAVWQTARNMTGPVKTQHIPSLRQAGQTFDTPMEKANLLVGVYEAVSSSSNYTPTFQAHKERFEHTHRGFIHPAEYDDGPGNTDTVHLNSEFTLSELRAALQQCKERSSPGPDMISYTIIKKLPVPTMCILLQVYNSLYMSGVMPAAWKHAIITPIIKPKKDVTDPQSYRPISLTSCLSKIIERMIARRLSSYLESRNILAPQQAGFRRGRGCMDHIMSLQDNIQRSMSMGGCTVGVFIDYDRAFDLLWREGLLYKIRKLKLGKNIYKFIENFLSDRTIQVRVGGTLSRVADVDEGTPQGTVMSPLFYILMTNDFPVEDPRLGGCGSCLFADDAAAHRSGMEIQPIITSMQRYLNKIDVYSQTWGFRISTSKTVCVLFTRNPRIEARQPPLSIGGNVLSYVKSVKFLGVMFDSRLNWAEHVTYISDKCTDRINLMLKITGQRWGGGKRVLLTLYKALILSLFDYGCPAFDSATARVTSRLSIIQNKALSICCGSVRSTSAASLEVETGIMPLALRRKYLSLKYATKIHHQTGNPTRDILKVRICHNKSGDKAFGMQTMPVLRSLKILDPQNQSSASGRVIAPDVTGVANADNLFTTDLSLSYVVDKTSQPPAAQKRLTERHLNDNYTGCTFIFTDGSVSGDRAGAAVVIPVVGHHRAVRLTDGVGPFSAELCALSLAVEDVPLLPDVGRSLVMVTDCLEVVRKLAAEGEDLNYPEVTRVRNNILQLTRTGYDVSLVWIPGHCDVQGNVEADVLAKGALLHTSIDYVINCTLLDFYHKIEKYILKLWQDRWYANPLSRHHFSVQPLVGKKCVFTYDKGRHLERCITRLRLGRCLTNSYLYNINKHPTGLCASCNVREDVNHLLMDCVDQAGLRTTLQQVCTQQRRPFTLHSLLNCRTCHGLIYKHFSVAKRRL